MQRKILCLGFLGIILAVSAAPNKKADGKKKCHNRQFQKQTEDKFSYTAVVQNGLVGTTDNVTEMELKANVFVSNADGCQFFLKLADVALSEKLGKGPSVTLTSPDFVKRLTSYGLQFTMFKGMVTAIQPSVESTEPDVLNIQRGILSMLQVKLGTKRSRPRFEDDVSGTCETSYIHRGKNNIEKSKDLNSCKDHKVSRSNIDGVPMFYYGMNKEDPLMKSTSVCVYRVNNGKKGLKSVVCKEHFLVRPFSSEMGAGAYVSTRSTLNKQSTDKVENWVEPYSSSYESTIKYDSSAQYKNVFKPSYEERVIALLGSMSQNDYRESKFKSAERFIELVASFRNLNQQTIGSVLTKVDLRQESVRSHLFDALAQCGTPACLSMLFETLKNNKMLSELPKLMPFLALSKEINPDVVRIIMGVRQQTRDPKLLLLISTMVYKMCKDRPSECTKKTSVTARLVTDLENELIRLLGKDCSKTLNNDAYFALKAIGNLGGPANAFPLIFDCIKNSEHVNISVAAIHSLRRMAMSRENRNNLFDVFTNRNEHLEKRAELFLMLMQDPREEDIILARDIANSDDESSQLRSLIYSYLKSATENWNVPQQRINERFRSVLRKYTLKEFNPSAARYSKAFTKTMGLARFGSTASGMSLFHPESFIPRTVRFNMTTGLFGYSMNPFEMDVRMEGMETVMHKFMGAGGALKGDFMRKMLDIPSLKKERKRRSTNRNTEYDDIDQQVNMKWLEPQAKISLKVFGNEIQVLTLDDLPFLKGEFGNRNIIRDLYELTKGKQQTYKKNLILLEVSHAVPTIIGLPVKVAVNVSATVTADLNGKVITKNILIGPKAVTLEGSLKPSISVHASGKVSTSCLGVGNIGTTFVANMHAAKEISGKVDYEQGKDVVIEMNAEKDIKDAMNITYNLFHVSTGRKEPIAGIPKRVNSRLCTSDTMDVVAAFGQDTCMEMSFPISYYNMSVPYFPLNGPFNFGIRSYPVDETLTKYRMVVKKTNNLYTLAISTPDSKYDRNYEVMLGSREEGSWDAGFVYGKERKGVVVSTRYQKQTNEMSASFVCNMTQIPIKSDIRFYNKTNMDTFDREIGGAVQLQVGRYTSEHKIYFKDKYDYVALGGVFNYMNGQTASIEMRVQYEPQMFSLTIKHPPTNTNIVAYGMPNVFNLRGGLNVTHGKFVMTSNGIVDVMNYTLEGHVNILPDVYKGKMLAYVDPKEKTFNINVDSNGQPFVWKASLKNLGYNWIEQVMTFSDKVVKMNTKWSSKMQEGSFSFKPWEASYKSNIDIKPSGGYEESGYIYIHGINTTYQSSSKRTGNKTVACTTGSYDNYEWRKSKFGNCVEKYIGPYKKGYVIKVMTEKGWIEPYVFMMNTGKDGSLDATLRIMHYVNIRYNKTSTNKMTFELKLMGFLSKMVVYEESGNEIKEVMVKMVRQPKSLSKSAAEPSNIFETSLKTTSNRIDSDDYRFKFESNGLTVNTQSILKNSEGKSFQMTHGIDVSRGDGRDMLFNVIMKDQSYSGADNKLADDGSTYLSADVIFDFNTDGDYLSGIEYRPVKGNPLKVLPPFKITDDITGDVIRTTFLTKRSSDDDFKQRFQHIFDTSKMTHQLKINMSDVVKIITNYISVRAEDQIDQIYSILSLIGVDDDDSDLLITTFEQSLIEYFTTFKCNSAELQKKYFTKENLALIHSTFTKLVFFPFTEEAHGLMRAFAESQTEIDLNVIAARLERITKFIDQSVVGIVMNALEKPLSRYMPNQKIPLKDIVKRFGETFQSEDVFAKKLVQYVQQLITMIQDAYMNKLKGLDIKKQLAPILKYIPGRIKSKFVKILKKTVTVFQTWRYNTSVSPIQNLKYLKKKLDDADFKQIFLFNHENIVMKMLFEHVKFPPKIETAVLEFMKNSDYNKLFIRLTRFVLVKYQVEGKVEAHIKKLMNSKTFEEFTEKFSKLKFKDGDDSKPVDLFASLKSILQNEYKVPANVLGVIDELFSKFDMKKVSLRDLPVMLVSNKIPNIIKKFIEFLKEKDLTEYLVKIIKVSYPNVAKNIDEFIKLIEGGSSLNEVVLQTYKLITKSIKEYLIDESTYDFEYLNKIEKYLQMILTDKDAAYKIKNMVIEAYDNGIALLTKQYPYIKSELGDLSNKLRIHLNNFDLQLMQKNTSAALLKFGGGIFKDLTDYFDKGFRAGLRDRIAQLPKLIMSQFLQNETLIKDYEVIWQQINLIYNMATTFIDDILKAGDGKFSTVTMVKHIIKRLRALNIHAVDAVLDAVDISKYANLTYDTFLSGIRQFFNDVGTVKMNSATLNEYVRNFILQLRNTMKAAYGPVNEYFTNNKMTGGKHKQFVQQYFGIARAYLQQLEKKENKMIKLIVEIFLPAIDGLFVFDRFSPEQTVDQCKMSFLASYGLYGKAAEVVPPQLLKKLDEYKSSVACDFAKLKDEIRVMKKDGTFLVNLLNKIESIVIKSMTENAKDAEKYRVLIESIMTGNALFKEQYDDKAGLGDIMFDVGNNAYTVLMKLDFFQKMQMMVQQALGKIGMKQIVQMYFIENLKQIPTLLTGPVQVIDDFGNTYVFPYYIKMKAKFHNVTMLLASAKEFVLDRITRFTNPENSDGYLKLLPEALSKKVKIAFERYQTDARSVLYMIENEIRDGFKLANVMFEKYRRELRSEIGKLKAMANKQISRVLSRALKTFEDFSKRLEKALKPVKDEDWNAADLKGKFKILSTRTKKLRLKYNNVKRHFVKTMQKMIWDRLMRVKELKLKPSELITSFIKESVNTNNLFKVLKVLNTPIRQNIKNAIAAARRPFFRLLQEVDARICQVKRLANKYLFPNSDNEMILNYNSRGIMSQDVVDYLLAPRDATSMKLVVYKLNFARFEYSDMKQVIERSFEMALKKYFEGFIYQTHMEMKFTKMFLTAYANYSDIPPDVLIKQLFSRYAGQINRTMLQINKAFQMSPPAAIERQIVRFFGLEFKPKPSMFEPLKRTAYLFERSLVTFDGTPIFLPQDINGKYSDCKYILTRDFLWRNFTVFLQQGKFVVEMQDAKVIVDRKNNNKVSVVSLMQPGVPAIEDFPVQFYFTTVRKLSNVLHVKNVFGLEVYCHLDVFSCNVTVPGYYHNKTLGLFGSNNVENYDDLKMPNGKIAFNLKDFINSYEITSNGACVIDSLKDIYNEEEAEKQRSSCDMFMNTNPRTSTSKYTFHTKLQSSAFNHVCRVENQCSVSKSFHSSTGDNIPSSIFCKCRDPPNRLDFNSFFSSSKANLHITLLVKLTPEFAKLPTMLESILTHLQTKYSDKVNMEFTIVGFGGNRVHREPHIHTAGGEVRYDVTKAIGVLKRLPFDGQPANEKLGISALKFAAPIKARRGMKIFMLFENDASYTNLLPQLMDVSDSLNKHGVILNVVNDYKMKPNVLAKDSHKTRYHLNLPEGESFQHSVNFPRTDDYIPFVKQTGGAVFLRKAFTDGGAGYVKALPTTVAEVLRKQIDQDAQQCKLCTCNSCQNVAKEECDFGLLRGRRAQM